MKSSQVVAIVMVVAVIALALGATIGSSVSSGRTSTTTTTQTYTVTTTSVFLGNSSTTNSSESSETSLDTTFTTNFYYPISINYSGSWRLTYWGQYGLVTRYNETQGSGNFETTVVTYGVGYVLNSLCAIATKLDSQNNLTLTLTVLTSSQNTTALVSSVQACGNYGV